MVYVPSVAPYGRVLLRTPDGVTLLGVHLVHLEEHLGTPARVVVQSAISWSFLIGDTSGLAVSWEDLRDAMRRWFDWKDLLVRSTAALAALGSSWQVACRTERVLTHLALSDSWPAEIDGWSELVLRSEAKGRTIAAVSEYGLLTLIADALRDPWVEASEPLAGDPSGRRLSRLVMIASDGPAAPEIVLASPSESNPYPSTRALVAAGRLCERDQVLAWLVRAHELYAELLPTECPDAERVFLTKRGCTISSWIKGVCGLVNLIEEGFQRDPTRRTVLDLGPSDDRPVNDALTVVAALSHDRDQFVARYRELQADPGEPSVMQPMREKPILQLDHREYLVLHDDFLLAAADDGIWYTINDALHQGPPRARFQTAFGAVLQKYVEKVINRAAAAAGDGSCVGLDTVDGEDRCDFAWRVGDYVMLAEVKRAPLRAADLTGRPELAEHVDKHLRPACSQLLSTWVALQRDGVSAVAERLGVKVGWRPKAYIPVIITHRPTFLWFGARMELVERAHFETPWRSAFGVGPVVWSLADLELLEAAAPHISLCRLAQAIVNDEPCTYANVPAYLASIKYNGVTVSEYVQRRQRDLLAHK